MAFCGACVIYRIGGKKTKQQQQRKLAEFNTSESSRRSESDLVVKGSVSPSLSYLRDTPTAESRDADRRQGSEDLLLLGGTGQRAVQPRYNCDNFTTSDR